MDDKCSLVEAISKRRNSLAGHMVRHLYCTTLLKKIPMEQREEEGRALNL